MTTAGKKITPTMVWWANWLAAGGVIERTLYSGPLAVKCQRRISWGMVDKLEEAGLVVWGDLVSVGRFGIRKCFLELTEAGRALVEVKTSSPEDEA